MPTTFANTINGNEILAKRSQCDYAGNDLALTYATKAEVTTGLASKEDSSNKAQTLDPSSTTSFPSSAATANYVNSSVATATANFLGNFTLADLGLTYPATDAQIGAALDAHTWPAGVTPTNNDYTYIEIENPQTTGIDDSVERFKFNGSNWVYEYTLNNSSFTAAEKAAIDSGIDSAKVAVYDAHVANSDIHVTLSDKSAWNAKQDAISDLATIRSGAAAGATAVQDSNYVHTDNNFTNADVTKLSGIEAGAEVNVQANWAESDSSSDSFIQNKPTIPTATSDLTNDSGFITLSDVPAQVNADWNSSSGASEILNKPTIPTVEQSYNASSTNAQSGVAVAQAIAAIPSSSYTAGDGIEIANGEISVEYDSDTLEIQQQHPVTHTYDVDQYSGSNDGVTPPDIVSQLRTVNVTVHIPGNTFYQWYMGQSVVIVFMADNAVELHTNVVAYCATPLSVTSSDGRFWLDEQDVVITALVGANVTCNYFTFTMLNGDTLNSDRWHCDTPTLPSPVQFSYAVPGESRLAVKNPLPASTVSDADKVLTVNAQGTPAWASASGSSYSAGTGIDITSDVISVDSTVVAMQTDIPTVPTTDQTYNSASTNPQSGTAVAGALASYTPTESLSTVALTGDFDDLTSKPTVKPLVAGSNITITENTNDITIAATGGGTTYTAGDGIDITSDVISADVDGTTIGIDPSTKKIKLLSTIPSVDQTYNSASTNAQSGTAVAGAIATKEDAFDVGTGLEMDTSGATPTLQVEAPVDIVAGPGIVIDNPDGNTLRVSVAQAEEVVLWNGEQLAGNTVTLSESAGNFEYLGVYVSIEGTGLTAPMFYKCMQRNSDPYGTVIRAGGDVCKSITSPEYQLYAWGGEVAIKGTSCQIGNFYRFHFNGGGLVDSTNLVRLHRVVGINRIANN